MNRLTRPKKLHQLKSHPIFSELTRTKCVNHLIFQPRNFCFFQVNGIWQKRIQERAHAALVFIPNWCLEGRNKFFLVRRMWRSIVPDTIFRCFIRLKQKDRTCWTIQTHSDGRNWARRRHFHELNSLSLVCLIKSLTLGLWALHGKIRNDDF